MGLCYILENVHWFNEVGRLAGWFPRCYCICNEEERKAFIDDFRLTACLNMAKWVVNKYHLPVKGVGCGVDKPNGMVKYGLVCFSM